MKIKKTQGLRRICQVCASGYNNNMEKCLCCGNNNMAKVVSGRVGTGMKVFTFEVEQE